MIPLPQNASKARRWPKRALITVCVFVVLGICAWVAFESYCRFRIREETARLRAEGYPTTLAEVNALYPQVPDEQNAALVLEAAFAHLPPWEAESELRESVCTLPAEMPLGDELSNRITELLASQTKFLELAHQAAAMPKARFPLAVDKQFAVAQVPHLAKVREVTGLLLLDSVLANEAGQKSVATRDLVDTLKLGELLKPEPLVISQLVRMTSSRFAKEGAERILARATPDDEDLRSLGDAFAESESIHLMSMALAAEACGSQLYFREYFKTSMDESVTEELGTVDGSKAAAKVMFARHIVDRVFFEPNLLALLEGYRGLVEAGRLPMHLRDQAAVAAVDALEDWPFPMAMVAKTMLPGLSRVYAAESRASAEVRVALTALAMERHRLARGEPPPTIGGLVPDFLDSIPTDPFDGKPLRYRRLEKGYVVYSLGMNGKDDGGTEEPDPTRKNNTLDIVFRVNR